MLVAAGLGLGVVGLSAWRPSAGCALMALAVPLTAGLGRDTLIPLLRPSEAMAIAVLAGLALNRLWRPRRLAFTGLDLAVLAFALGSVVIPVVVLTSKDITPDDRRRLTGSVELILQKGAVSRETILSEIRSLLKNTAASTVDARDEERPGSAGA